MRSKKGDPNNWKTMSGLGRVVNLHDVPDKITIDKIGANTTSIESIKVDAC